MLYEWGNNLIDTIFFFDICINFRTTFVNQATGDEIWRPLSIAKNYILSLRFWIDIMSTFPFDKVITSGGLADFVTLLGMLKIVRVSRISKIIANLNVKQESKAFFKVINLIFLLVLYIHVMACFMYYIVQDSGKLWIPPLDFINYNPDLLYKGTRLYFSTIAHKYSVMMYHSAMIFGVIEIAPRTNLEVSLSCINRLGFYSCLRYACFSHGKRQHLWSDGCPCFRHELEVSKVLANSRHSKHGHEQP